MSLSADNDESRAGNADLPKQPDEKVYLPAAQLADIEKLIAKLQRELDDARAGLKLEQPDDGGYQRADTLEEYKKMIAKLQKELSETKAVLKSTQNQGLITEKKLSETKAVLESTQNQGLITFLGRIMLHLFSSVRF